MRKSQRGALPELTRPSGVDSIRFRDGMIVTADDLDTAQSYAASLLRTVLRSFFGCGVVRGLDLNFKDPAGSILIVKRGLAIDCHGHPVELCKPVELDLSPPECGHRESPGKVSVLLRRVTSREEPCDCAAGSEDAGCRRVQEHVMVKAVTGEELAALPGEVCEASDEHDDCGCGGGKCWVLLGSVELTDDWTFVPGSTPDLSRRAVVHPLRPHASAPDSPPPGGPAPSDPAPGATPPGGPA